MRRGTFLILRGLGAGAVWGGAWWITGLHDILTSLFRVSEPGGLTLGVAFALTCGPFFCEVAINRLTGGHAILAVLAGAAVGVGAIQGVNSSGSYLGELIGGFLVALCALSWATIAVETVLPRSPLLKQWVASTALVGLWFVLIGCLLGLTGRGGVSHARLREFAAEIGHGFVPLATILTIFGGAAVPPRRRAMGAEANHLVPWPSLEPPPEEAISGISPGVDTGVPAASDPSGRRRWAVRAGLAVALLAIGAVLGYRLAAAGSTSHGAVPEPALFFSPKGGCTEAVVAAVNGAKSEIRIAMYSLTRSNIRDALIEAKQRGVDVRVIVDRSQAGSQFSAWKWLKDAGIEVRFSTQKKGYMHHKYGVIDRERVLTGSFNWTGNAEGFNQENLLVLDSSTLAAKYLANWEKIPCDGQSPVEKTATAGPTVTAEE